MSPFYLASAEKEYSETLRSELRGSVDRKILRFLSPKSLPAFACVLDAANVITGIDPARTALFTVSGFESLKEYVPVGRAELEGLGRDELRRVYYGASNPTTGLSALNNAALCQAAIVTRIQGPSMHVMGDGADVLRLILIADRTFREDTADAAIIVGYDVTKEPIEPETGSTARAMVLTPDEEKGRAVVDVESARAASGTSAVSTLNSCIKAAEELNSQDAVSVLFGDQVAVRVRRLP